MNIKIIILLLVGTLFIGCSQENNKEIAEKEISLTETKTEESQGINNDSAFDENHAVTSTHQFSCEVSQIIYLEDNLEKANYCKQDLDCVKASKHVGCNEWLVNKNEKEDIDKKIGNYYKNCADFEVQCKVPQILEVNIKCKNNRCIDADYCNLPPKQTDIGRLIYPVNENKYGNLSFLSELFTAHDCGKERVSEIFGVSGSNYTLGSHIKIRLDKDLIQLLQEIGYKPSEKCNGAEACSDWILKEQVPLKDILKLKPYTEKIQWSDCILCG